MPIEEIHQKYIDREEFNNPDYERNDDLLFSFKSNYSKLSNNQENKLIELLKSNEWVSMYFVADLLYYYSDFGFALMETMLQTGVHFADPSFNRIFLRPCIRSKKKQETMDWLIDKFKSGTFIERIGVSKLYYWLGCENVDRSKLKIEIYNKAKSTNNIIELYFYKLAIENLGFRWIRIPKDTQTLVKKLKGNPKYRKLLIEDLKWNIE